MKPNVFLSPIMRVRRFWEGLVCVSVVVLSAASACAADNVVRLSGDVRPETVTYGLDFEWHSAWGSLSDEAKNQLAAAVGNSGVRYVRIPLLGDAEHTEGTIDESVYADTLDLMRRISVACPAIRFFATPRALDEKYWGRHALEPYTYYPLWVSMPDRAHPMVIDFKPEKAADFFVRHLRFFMSKGFKITYLDLKDEIRVKYPVSLMQETARHIKEALGNETPLLVGPSGVSCSFSGMWVQEAANEKKSGPFFLDIVTTRTILDTKQTRFSAFSDFLPIAKRTGKPVWVSELRSVMGPDKSMCISFTTLFGYLARGAEGVCNFHSLGRADDDQTMFRPGPDGALEISRLYYLYRQVAMTSQGGHYIPLALPWKDVSGAAFICGRQLTVWLINGGVPQTDVKVDIGDRKMEGARIKMVCWDRRRGGGAEGSFSEQAVVEGGSTFTIATLPTSALICCTVTVK